MARETFGVENVVARIYDPGRAEVYQRLGIPTVATVRWTADQMLRRLLPKGAAPEHRDPSGQVVARRGAAARRLGRPAGSAEIEEVAGAPRRLPHPARRGRRSPTRTRCYQDGDLVHLVTATDVPGTVERKLDQPPPVH